MSGSPSDRPPRRPLGVVLLGCTGSIGTQALDVIDRFPDRFWVVGLLSGRRPPDRRARHTVRADDPDAALRIREMVTDPDCDIVLVAMPGARALEPTLAALDAGKHLAIATKEVLVMAGEVVMRRARPGAIRPVDSEHSAIWQCLWGEAPESVARLILTATGGPLWRRRELDWRQVTVEDALRHPTWSMGPKVTVDSATLMNKGLETIEAHHLFGLPLERIEVVIHPQSVIHSLVEFVDGAAKAQLSHPDMRLPIALALSYPERLPGVVPRTAFAEVGELALEPLDRERFPSVDLARQAAARGGGYPAVLNAANEEAVAAFLDRRITFADILPLVRSALDDYRPERVEPASDRPTDPELDSILAADAFARGHVCRRLGRATG